MAGKVIFDSPEHKVFLFEELTPASAVQANQYLIIHRDEAMLLDPGGHKVQSKLFADISVLISPKQIRYIFLSHQDPDIVASINYWLMVTEAEAIISKLWTRFLPHFGLDSKLEGRVLPVDDGGTRITLGGDCELLILPAHFLHSPGNFQVYDPVSKILFSGDLGASLGQEYFFVENFEDHIRYMEGFHRRYMASRKILKLWVRMVRQLEVDTVAPQHGAVFKGRAMVEKLLSWLEGLECGVDIMKEEDYTLP
jgi:flavorubredoxin